MRRIAHSTGCSWQAGMLIFCCRATQNFLKAATHLDCGAPCQPAEGWPCLRSLVVPMLLPRACEGVKDACKGWSAGGTWAGAQTACN
jgi:hypothetical protein